MSERLRPRSTLERAIAKKARAAIALIRSKKDEIARDFYAIGRALVDKGVIAALGHSSFAKRLMDVVRSFSARDAEKLTAAKATAIIDLASGRRRHRRQRLRAFDGWSSLKRPSQPGHPARTEPHMPVRLDDVARE